MLRQSLRSSGGEEAGELSERLVNATTVKTSALAVYEAVFGLARAQTLSIPAAELAVLDLLSAAKAEVVPITAEIGRGAIDAFARYGRGRHPAQLNLGECFAYACARALDAPLLYKGDDFRQTDIASG